MQIVRLNCAFSRNLGRGDDVDGLGAIMRGIHNARVDDSVILERESWWKETLQSRKFGYNAN